MSLETGQHVFPGSQPEVPARQQHPAPLVAPQPFVQSADAALEALLSVHDWDLLAPDPVGVHVPPSVPVDTLYSTPPGQLSCVDAYRSYVQLPLAHKPLPSVLPQPVTLFAVAEFPLPSSQETVVPRSPPWGVTMHEPPVVPVWTV